MYPCGYTPVKALQIYKGQPRVPVRRSLGEGGFGRECHGAARDREDGWSGYDISEPKFKIAIFLHVIHGFDHDLNLLSNTRPGGGAQHQVGNLS